jgi:hypothetical protein
MLHLLLPSHSQGCKEFATTCFTRHVGKKSRPAAACEAETLGKKAAEGSPCLVRVTDDDVDELIPIARAVYIELLYMCASRVRLSCESCELLYA